MNGQGFTFPLRLGLITLALAAILAAGYYLGRAGTPAATPTVVAALPALITPTPTATLTATPSPQATPTPVRPTATPSPQIPPGGIVYALSPDINSVGWVQDGESGNHFGESYLYAGVRDGSAVYGAMQFDLSFMPKGTTIFMAELELTGLSAEGLTQDSSFALNILKPDVDQEWSRHTFETLQNAAVDETLTSLEAGELAEGQTTSYVFNAAQRSIIEERLESSRRLSIRIDSLFPEGWFGWDSGYGQNSRGLGPILRLGVLPPVTTDVPPGSTPTPTPTFVVITSTPTPENLATMVAQAVTATYQATATGTATPLPKNWVTPVVVTHTPTPENTATALYQWAEATAAVIAYGTPTPTAINIVTATPTPTSTPTPIFILLEGELPPTTPTPTPIATLEPTPPIPAQLIGKIAFKSDRTGREEIYVINPDGTGIALLTNRWPYLMAELADTFSADGRFRVFTKDMVRYQNFDLPGNIIETARQDIPAIYWYDALYNAEELLTRFGRGMAYSGVWSPVREQIAFVSNDSGDDEIWVVNRDGSNLLQLTKSNEAYNAREIGKDTFVPEVSRHPSWSPDGNQIVFWSNRTGHAQIWVMNADGSNLYSLSRTGFNDWDPVWIKYPGLPPDALKNHIPYNGPYDPSGALRSCADFATQSEAQAFYLAAGGPYRDPHQLDSNGDGIACREG